MTSMTSSVNFDCPITYESMVANAMSLSPCGHHVSEPGAINLIEKKGLTYNLNTILQELARETITCPLCRSRITNIHPDHEHRQKDRKNKLFLYFIS